MNRLRSRRSVFTKLLWALLALAVGEVVLVFYYLDSWLTLPLL
jgi:hypothetical protein